MAFTLMNRKQEELFKSFKKTPMGETQEGAENPINVKGSGLRWDSNRGPQR